MLSLLHYRKQFCNLSNDLNKFCVSYSPQNFSIWLSAKQIHVIFPCLLRKNMVICLVTVEILKTRQIIIFAHLALFYAPKNPLHLVSYSKNKWQDAFYLLHFQKNIKISHCIYKTSSFLTSHISRCVIIFHILKYKRHAKNYTLQLTLPSSNKTKWFLFAQSVCFAL